MKPQKQRNRKPFICFVLCVVEIELLKQGRCDGVCALENCFFRVEAVGGSEGTGPRPKAATE